MTKKSSNKEKDSSPEQISDSAEKAESDILKDAFNAARQAVDGAGEVAKKVTTEPGHDGPTNRTFLRILAFLAFIAILGVVITYRGTVDKVIERIPVAVPPGELKSGDKNDAAMQNSMQLPELGTHVPVDANKRWNPIATVSTDKKYKISVTGHWSNNKSPTVPFVDYQGREDPVDEIKTEDDREQYWKKHSGNNAPLVPRYKVAALIGQIGANPEFLLEPHGKDNPWTPADAGALYAFMNDGDAGNGLDENQGKLTVTIEEVK